MEEISNPKEEVSKTSKLSSFWKGIPKHNWAIATYILALVLIMMLINNYSGFNLTGNAVSESKMETLVNDFVNQQLLQDGDATILDIKEESGLYVVNISFDGEAFPLYFTRDGNFIRQGGSLVPLIETAVDTTPDTQPTTTVPKSSKPKVELFVMSHCPYGTMAEKGIIPAVEALGSKIDFEIRFVYYAMHGETEVKEQLNQYCIQKEQNSKYLPYLKCFLESKSGSAEEGASCLVKAGIDKTKLVSCTASADKEFEVTANLNDKSKWLSGYYPLFNIDKELNEKYNIGGSPTLVINGVQASSARDSASYLKTICSAFETAPSECDKVLSSTSPSAGFGSSTSGSATDATCG
ncbi:MAG: hypothetical protein WC533_03540 [Candidatus Pacearchaeota archaeon]